VNVLKPHLQTTLRTLLERNASQREIERVTGIDRKTIRSYQKRFAASYNSVKRFVRKLVVREPKQFDRLSGNYRQSARLAATSAAQSSGG
jgi:hypothetical protein